MGIVWTKPRKAICTVEAICMVFKIELIRSPAFVLCFTINSALHLKILVNLNNLTIWKYIIGQLSPFKLFGEHFWRLRNSHKTKTLDLVVTCHNIGIAVTTWFSTRLIHDSSTIKVTSYLLLLTLTCPRFVNYISTVKIWWVQYHSLECFSTNRIPITVVFIQHPQKCYR